jgi:polysaccharide export outer membrane protein
MVFAGCSHLYYADPNPPSPYVFPGQSPSPGLATPNPVSPSGPPVAVATPTGNPSLPTPTTGGGSHTVSDILAIGDSVTVSFSDIPPPGLLPVIQRIGNDGKITLPYNVKVTAAGKTVGQLQDDIRKEYVPAIFVFMTCSVKSEERVFYVDGEVKLAGRLPYLGEMTVLRAISSAQGFTDFAQRHKIEVRRATGQKVMIDWYKAMKNTSLDVPVYPNDHIIVRRRVW